VTFRRTNWKQITEIELGLQKGYVVPVHGRIHVGRAEVQLYSFLTSVLDEGEGQHYTLATTPPGNNPGTQ